MSPEHRALLDAVAVVPHTDADGLAAGAIALVDGRVIGPGGPLALTSYGELPETPTAPLMRRIVPEAPAWLAAVGAAGDLGDAGFALPECAGAVPRTAIKRLVSLVNAPRRLPDGPVRTALALLVEHDDPRAALGDARVAELEDAKATWRAEFDRVVHTAPRMVGEAVALLRFSSPAQIHPLVATAWARRLAPRIVLAANDGYLGEGNVSSPSAAARATCAACCSPRCRTATSASSFAHGHDRATGGSLPEAEFERLLANLVALPAGD